MIKNFKNLNTGALPPLKEGPVASPETMAKLEQAAAKAEAANKNVKAAEQVMGDESISNAEIALEQLFGILRSNGVDPENPESISQFLEMVKMENPDGYEYLEDSIINILNQQDMINKMEDMPSIQSSDAVENMINMGAPASPMGIDLDHSVNKLTRIPGVPGQS